MLLRCTEKQGARTKPKRSSSGGKEQSSAHTKRCPLGPAQLILCCSSGVRAPGAKPEARQSRVYRRLECHGPERNGLALVKLKATTGNEQVHRYPTGICAWAYLFHSVAILKDSHENLAQTDRWPELRVPSHHTAALKGDPGTCTRLATHLGRDRPGSAAG